MDKAQVKPNRAKWQRAEDYVIPFHKVLLQTHYVILFMAQICVLRVQRMNGNHEHLRQVRDEEEMGEGVEGAGC